MRIFFYQLDAQILYFNTFTIFLLSLGFFIDIILPIALWP